MMKKVINLVLTLTFAIGVSGAEYNILHYGAKADTTYLSTNAIQQAIDECSKAGGGKVLVPAGEYKTGSIFLKSNVNLHLEQGAILYGSTNLDDYTPVKSDYISLRTQTTTIQLIYADKAGNITIDGIGTIDGRGRAFKKLSWNDEGITRPHLIRFIQCHDVVVKDVSLRNSGCWMQHYLACDRLSIDGIKVFNRNNYNNDALDIDGCHNVIVRGMLADSDDDAITLKSTSPRLCENVRISDCVVSSHCNAIKLGTETNGGFRNIAISGIVVKPSEDQNEKFFGQWRGSSVISLEITDGGTIENVCVRDIVALGTEAPIFVWLGNRARSYQEGKVIDHVGTIKGVRIEGVTVYGAGNTGCSVVGMKGHPIEDMSISNIRIHHDGGVEKTITPPDDKEKEYPEATMLGILPAKGFFVRHTRNVAISDITITTVKPDQRPDIVYEDAE